MICTRIELRDKVRRLGKSPHISDTQAVERDREALTSHMATLTHLQNVVDIADHDVAPSRITRDNEAEFDNLDDIGPSEKETPASSGPSHLRADINTIPIEERPVYLPCNGDLAYVEINLRKNQASRLLHQLRELVADKSFQYSHIIRAAPRKGVRTRARAVIQDLVNKIALHARIYNHCRSRLVALDCDAETSNMFQRLTKGDLNASTAIVKPNAPGSTNLRLSWIWHNTHIQRGVIANHDGMAGPIADADADASHLWECKWISWPLVLITLMLLQSGGSIGFDHALREIDGGRNFY